MKCKIELIGEGPKNAKVMLIGEAPGKDEIRLGKPFIGRSGRFLTKTLDSLGIDRKKLFITNVLKFRPTRIIDGKVKDRPPRKDEMKACMPILNRQISRINPKLVVLLGNSAISSLLGEECKVGMCHGKKFVKNGIIYIPTFHPAYVMRNRRPRKLFFEDLKKVKRLVKI